MTLPRGGFVRIVVSRGETSHITLDYAQSRMDNMHTGAVSVTLCCFIDRVVLVQHLGDSRGLQAVMYGSVEAYVTLQRDPSCQHVVLSPADLSQRGAGPPAGAICIPDRTIHHPRCSAQFSVLLQTAWGSTEQLYMYALVMRALETCLVALKARIKSWRESMSQSLRLNPSPSPRVVSIVDFFSKCLIVVAAALNLEKKKWLVLKDTPQCPSRGSMED